MPRNPDAPGANDSYILSDAFRHAAYAIGIEALKLDKLMSSRLWLHGTRSMPRPAYDDLEAAYRTLGEAYLQVGRILVSAQEREAS